jgi:glycosyltransferase involved in cell wall biosynthesis
MLKTTTSGQKNKMNKAKILFIGELPRKNNIGGSHIVNCEILNYLTKDESFEIIAVSPLFKNEEIADWGFPVEFLKTKYFRSKGLGDIAARISFCNQTKKFLKQIQFRPDLIHIDASPYLIKLAPEIPKVLFLHGSDKFKEGIIDLINYPYSTLCSWLNDHYEKRAIYDRNIRKIFINSELSKKTLIADYQIPNDIAQKIMAVKLGFNIKRFRFENISQQEAKNKLAQKIKLTPQSFIISFIGGIAPQKGQAELIQTMPTLINQYPNLFLILIGKNSGDLKRCQSLIKNLNLEKNTAILGSLYNADLGLIVKATDIYVSASTESFGINQVEAMGAGLPLVAWDRGAVKELFTNGQEGFLVNSRNEFIKKLQILIENKNLRRKMAKRAKIHAEKTFSWEKLGEEIKKSYLEILRSYSKSATAQKSQ